jgi:hypothetical protein
LRIALYFRERRRVGRLLFEAGKLSSFALIHRKALPRLLKVGLACVATTLVCANVAGVSGFLSNQYERSHISATAHAHAAESSRGRKKARKAGRSGRSRRILRRSS